MHCSCVMASNSTWEGGAHTFVGPVPEKFICSICTNTLCDPQLTECCGQHFCKRCLQSWFKKQMTKSCPHCRTRGLVHMLDKPVQREINCLKIRCSHHSEGCKWIGDLGDLQMHLQSNSGCGYEEVECPNRCADQCDQGLHSGANWATPNVGTGVIRAFLSVSSTRHQCFHKPSKPEVFTKPRTQLKTCLRKDLQEHLLSQCPLRRYTCQHCGLENTYKNVTQTHYGTCPNFPLGCPNGCGMTAIKRKDIPTHREQCPLEKLQCPNKCTNKKSGYTTVCRKDLQNHLQKECYNRPCVCKFCGKKDTFKSLTHNHISVCPSFPLNCPNTCGVTEIKRCDMSTHRQQCPLEPVQCPNGCSQRNLQRKDLKEHTTAKCSLRKHKCEHCSYESTHHNVTTVHYTTCPDMPFDCPNECGATGIKRKNLPTHRNKCPLESVQCPYQKAGCGVRCVRKDLDEHMTSQIQHHLLLMLRKTCLLEEECTQLKKKNTCLERRCHALETKNSELQKRVEVFARKNSRSRQYPRPSQTMWGQDYGDYDDY